MASENIAKYEQQEVLEEFKVKQEYQEETPGEEQNLIQALDELDNLLDEALDTTRSNVEPVVSLPCSEDIGLHCFRSDFNTKRKRNLNQHKQAKHEGVRYSCDQCDYRATTQEKLKETQTLKT